MALPGVSTREPRTGYEVVIIGAGIQGLALAYELAKKGMTDVLVVDRGWPGGGASGRNGELIRSAFGSPEWCGLFEMARRRWINLSAELDYNILFNRTGYSILATTEQQWDSCTSHAAFHKSQGIESELLDAPEARELLPAVNPDMVRGAVHQGQAGFAHHDSVVAAYLRRAAGLGVHVIADCEVVAVESDLNTVAGVRTANGRVIECATLVNAAGGNAPEVDSLLGLRSPVVPARLEMLVTQPVRPFLKPGLAALEILGYCHQTGRGEFVGGTEKADLDHTTSLNGSWHMLKDMATKFTKLFPLLAGVNVLRHWAGTVSQTPDSAPVLGPTPEMDGYLLSIGWVYGFMGAPAAGELLAKYILHREIDPRMAPFGIDRVATGNWINEGSLVFDLGN